MDKTRIYISIGWCVLINAIIKAIIIWLNSTVKTLFKEKGDRIIEILKIVYPLLNVIFIFIMPRVYPAMFFPKYQYFLNTLFYGAFILAIYLWFFKTIVNKIIDMITKYQLNKKNGGEDNV